MTQITVKQNLYGVQTRAILPSTWMLYSKISSLNNFTFGIETTEFKNVANSEVFKTGFPFLLRAIDYILTLL
jgi:hypothetical protein